jgi:hypothetical protein
VIAKDGHIGIVERTGKPIAKPVDTQSEANAIERSYVSHGSLASANNKINNNEAPNS